ncbi:Nucleolar complex protein 4 [Gonapodya sp. JEL0774]|nr:Nucleolar complex protein 4 [Gonapodya sp. JEL0774]
MPSKKRKTGTGASARGDALSVSASTPRANTEERSGENTLKLIARLEHEFTTSRTNANNLLELLSIAKSESNPEVVHAVLQSLQRIFVALLKDGELDKPSKKSVGNSEELGMAGKPKAQKRNRDGEEADALDNSPEVAIRSWLRRTYSEYQEVLLVSLRSDEAAVQLLALRLFLALVKLSTIRLSHRSRSYSFDAALMYRAVEALVLVMEPTQTDTKKVEDRNDEPVGDTYTIKMKKREAKRRARFEAHLGPAIVEAATKWDDVRLFLWRGVTKACDNWTTESNAQKASTIPPTAPSTLFYILSSLPPPSSTPPASFLAGDPSSFHKSTSKSEPPQVLDPDIYKRAFSDAWLALLRVPLDDATLEEALVVVHRRIVPHMTGPARLMDFLTAAYDSGGVLSILALNGVFALVQHHNLDYPNFYPKLYRLLDEDLMRVKYLSRFLRLLDLFLSSSHLPAYLVAAFAKRLSRLLLHAPPAACIAVLPLIHNLLKRHPACLVLIHRSDAQIADWRTQLVAKGGTGTGYPDPYDHTEQDPAKCNALMSSLWEVKTMRNHYLPAVKGLARAFEDRMGREEFTLEEFLDEDYVTLLEAELSRKMKVDAPPIGAKVDLSWIEKDKQFASIIKEWKSAKK